MRKSLKEIVFQRDGAFCKVCGSKERLTLDHIVPLALGGANSAENLQVLCEPCHVKKNVKDAKVAKNLFFSTKFPDKEYKPNGR